MKFLRLRFHLIKDNKLGDEGAAKISESLMTNTTLTELNLGGDDNIIKNKQE